MMADATRPEVGLFLSKMHLYESALSSCAFEVANI
jgi:hypothetical protein